MGRDPSLSYPGDGINGILVALDRALGRFNFVQVRHEEEAALMATAHAKFTGGLGVCLATSGPGAIHLLNGLYDAKLDHQSVLAIVGQSARAAIGGDFQQEVDLHSLFKDVASNYVQTCTTAVQMRHLVDRAVRIALAERCVTCLIVPNDVQELAAQQPPQVHGTIHSGIGYSKPRVVPAEADLKRAADVMNAGEKVAMLVGADASHQPMKCSAAACDDGAGQELSCCDSRATARPPRQCGSHSSRLSAKLNRATHRERCSEAKHLESW